MAAHCQQNPALTCTIRFIVALSILGSNSRPVCLSIHQSIHPSNSQWLHFMHVKRTKFRENNAHCQMRQRWDSLFLGRGEWEGKTCLKIATCIEKMKVELFKLQLNSHMHTFRKYETKPVAISVKNHTHTHIQDVPGGMCKTSGECSLC